MSKGVLCPGLEVNSISEKIWLQEMFWEYLDLLVNPHPCRGSRNGPSAWLGTFHVALKKFWRPFT